MSLSDPLPGAAPTASAAAAMDANVVALLRAGGKSRQTAVSQLYTRYARHFRNYYRRHGASETQADDLVQETFVKVLRALESWSGAGTLEAWLWTVARNTLMSDFRNQRGDAVAMSLDDQEPEVAEGLLNRAGASSDPADVGADRKMSHF